MSSQTHTAESQIAGTVPHPYHMVEPSIWPLFGAVSAILIATGIIFVAHYNDYWFLAAGFVGAVSTMVPRSPSSSGSSPPMPSAASEATR